MRYRFYTCALLGIIIAVAAGCGGGGAPGSSGSETTGIIITSTSIDRENPDIDAAAHVCTSGSSETLTREDATINIGAEAMNPDLPFDQFPASVESCTIVYKKANEDPGAPALDSLTIYPNCTIQSGSNPCPVTLIDIERKNQYTKAVLIDGTHIPAEYPTHYIAQYTCNYVNVNGKSGKFQAELDIWLADFETCGG